MTSPAAPSNITASVDSIAMQYGVPTGIWEDIAYTESGYRYNAVGDGNTSFGLFQLHVGGQLPAQYNSDPTQVFDPTLNAQIAMPAIARAWSNLKGSFDPNSAGWWQQFAAQSGHPGGSPGNSATNNEAAILQKNYSGAGPGCAPNDLVCQAESVAGANAGAQTAAAGLPNPFDVIAGVQQAAPNALIHIALFLAALGLLVVGFLVVVNSKEAGQHA